MSVDTAGGQITKTVPYDAPEALFLGVAFSPDGSKAYAAAGHNNKIRTYDLSGGSPVEGAPLKLATTSAGSTIDPFPAGLAVSADGKTLYAADHLANAISIVDVATGDESRVALSDRTCTIKDTGDDSNGRNCVFPYTVALSHDGATAYVSDWGGHDISIVDTSAKKLAGKIAVGEHPSAMVLNPRSDELYVAGTDDDTIAVVDTATNAVRRTISLAPYRDAAVGTSPNALAVSPDGRTLYVAEAGNNAIAVVRLAQDDGRDDVAGLIPTGWYPTGVAVDPSGAKLYVANARGLGAGPNPAGPVPGREPESSPDQYIGSMIHGTLSTIAVPGDEQLQADTRQVADNNGVEDTHGDDHGGRGILPRHRGGRSPIKHVIYEVNENRTYDQVLGDLPRGNGDPSLALFGRGITPNHHRLAEQFTTLDNLYAAGEVSDDGWEWSTAAEANSLTQKTQPTNYGGRGHFYVGEGGTLAAAPGREAARSYIWDALDDAHISYRNYGFWATGTPPVQVFNEPNLDAHTDHAYAGFNMQIPDQDRFAEWQKEFNGYVAAGDLPAVEFLKFPRDHTCGTSPDCPTPRAMVADSDLALGRLVDAVSHSRFWASTAIFVIEDDAQDGPDHVDAHRTVGHVISPYTQLGSVDSTFYSSVSMLHTIELLLGLRPLTQFDAVANPMARSFANKPKLTPYVAQQPSVSLTEANTPASPLAARSARMDFSKEDRAPEHVLNEAIWQSVKGGRSRMPAPRHRAG
jgi:YVTN family beta-propeller protein